MSEHAIEVVSEDGEISLRLVCQAVKGAPCRLRPADPEVEEWSSDYEGELVDSECWALEWQDAVGFVDGVRSDGDGVLTTFPVRVGCEEGVLVWPIPPHPMLAGLESHGSESGGI